MQLLENISGLLSTSGAVLYSGKGPLEMIIQTGALPRRRLQLEGWSGGMWF